jgi:hypothetical protein
MALISDTPDLHTFECVGCLSTYTGKAHELSALGWVSHKYERRVAPKRNKGEVLLCEECEKRFELIWTSRKAQ